MIAIAWRRVWREGYDRRDFLADLQAGLVVGIVALPLSMALAIATGVAPQHGLYTAIVAGFLVALIGGSRVQVSGPTAAFVAMLVPIVHQYGLSGLLTASCLAGLILIAMGVAKFGQWIQLIPSPVVTGFTTGIALVIASLQIKDFLGLTMTAVPPEFLDRLAALGQAVATIHWADAGIGVVTLALLIWWPRVTRAIPAPLVALAVATLAGVWWNAVHPELAIATIRSRFSFVHNGVTLPGIPNLLPHFQWPWNWPDAHGAVNMVSWLQLRALFPAAFAIAMLGAIESLLSAVVADGMTGRQHDSDSELIAQGVGNLVAPFFGGFAATGALARTATNIRSGAHSPLAAMTHALVILVAMLGAAQWLGFLPMSALAALLLIIAWNMSEVGHFLHICRVAPRGDTLVLLTCFILTVLFDMVTAVFVGVMLAALIFIRRISELTSTTLMPGMHALAGGPLPRGVIVYEIAGPMFFGAAQRAMEALHEIREGITTVILDVESVPAMDATGLTNLESALSRLARQQIQIILAGVQPQPRALLERAHLATRFPVRFFASVADAVHSVTTVL